MSDFFGRPDIIEAIEAEINYARGLGSDRVEAQERPHSTGEYLTMLRTYLREAEERWTRYGGDKQALDSVRKVAAIAVRCMADNGVVKRGDPA